MTGRANALARLPGAVSNRGLRVITGSSAVAHDRRFKISRRHARGQALVEFAIVVPLLLAVLGGIIQFGVIFWSQNTLTQIVRDTGRWEASQQTKPCSSQATADAVALRAGSIAQNASLIGYPGSQPWTTGTLSTTWPPVPDNRRPEGVEVAWPNPDPANPPNLDPLKDCPPSSNSTAWFVTIRISHVIPVFIPGMQYLPGIGDQACTCLSISATTTFRMEPAPP
jgi:TadE-like protein